MKLQKRHKTNKGIKQMRCPDDRKKRNSTTKETRQTRKNKKHNSE